MNKTLCKLLAWMPIWFPSLLIEIWAWSYTGATVSQNPEGFWNVIATFIVVLTLVIGAIALLFLAIWFIMNVVHFCQRMEKNCADIHDDN